MKILGYEIRPSHTLYAGMITMAGCVPSCNDNKIDVREFGNKMEYRMTSEAREALNNYVFHMRQHGMMKCKPQAISAILMAASASDGDMTNEITLKDLQPILAKEAKVAARTYKDEIPGLEDIASTIGDDVSGE